MGGSAPKISLCLIARDEERLLPGCLESASEAVDEVVLVDTGSQDRTREIARAAGALVLERPWDDDFAAPRNLAASRATGEFILQLDADERLAPGAGRAVRRAVRNARFDVGMVRCHNADALDAPLAEVLSGARRAGQPALLPRLLRHGPDLRWQGCIHESVLEWVAARGSPPVKVPVDLVHLGYTNPIFDGKEKRARNLALLRKRVREEPESAVSHGYLAAELLADGALEEAERVAEAGWALLDRQPRHRSVRRLLVVRAAVAIGRNRPEAALEASDALEAREGKNPDLFYHRACALELLAARAGDRAEREGLLARARAALEEARSLLEKGGFEQVMHASPVQVWAHLGLVSLRQGRPAEALEAFTTSRAAGAVPRIALGEAEALLALSRPGDALRALEPLLSMRGEAGAAPEGWLLAARAAQAMGAAADARAFAARAAASGQGQRQP